MTLDRKSEKPTIQGHFFYNGRSMDDTWPSLRRPDLFSPREKRLGRKERLGGTGVYRMGFRRQIRLAVPASMGLHFHILLRAALQLEPGLAVAAFEWVW